MHAATLLTVAFSAFALAQQVDQPVDEQPTEVDNPATSFLTETNGGGAVTGQPDPETSQPTGDVPTLSDSPSEPAPSTLVPSGSITVSGSGPAESSPASETGDDESPSGTEGPKPTKTGGGGGAGSGPNASQTGGSESGTASDDSNASATESGATESATGAAAIATAAPAGIGLGIAGAVFAAFL